MEEDTDRWDISELLTAFEYDNWYESPDVTLVMIKERGMAIPQTAKWRIPALQSAVNNSEGVVTKSDIIDIVMTHMGVSTEITARKYVDKLDFSESGGYTLDFVSDGVNEIAEMLLETTPEKHKHRIASMPDYERVGLTKDVHDIDGTYPSLDEAIEAFESAKEMAASDCVPAQVKARNTFIGWVDRELKNIEENGL